MWAGEDGVILTYDVSIPDDAQPGDTFPIKFNYVVTPAADPEKGEPTRDLFTTSALTKERDDAKAEIDTMTDYAVKNWVDGYIKIADKVVTTTSTTTTTTTTNNNKFITGTNNTNILLISVSLSLNINLILYPCL